MPYYLIQWKFKDPQIKALTDSPHDRTRESRKAVEAFGGVFHHYFFAFGDYDGFVLAEFPDNQSAMASVLTIAGSGGLAATKTTVLMTADVARTAMNMAGSVATGYTLPTGYSAHG